MTEALHIRSQPPADLAPAPPAPLYAQVMGARFDALPRAVREMHTISGQAQATGRAAVERGSGLARLVAAAFGFPPASQDVPLRVDFDETGGVETWTRDFGGHSFRSRLSLSGGQLVEAFGPFRFHFDLESQPDGLAMRLRRWRLGPLTLPLVLAPRIQGREWEDGGRFHFEVEIAPPMIGLMIGYRGWLELRSRPHAEPAQ